jgi:hypothetical protein
MLNDRDPAPSCPAGRRSPNQLLRRQRQSHPKDVEGVDHHRARASHPEHALGVDVGDLCLVVQTERQAVEELGA